MRVGKEKCVEYILFSLFSASIYFIALRSVYHLSLWEFKLIIPLIIFTFLLSIISGIITTKIIFKLKIILNNDGKRRLYFCAEKRKSQRRKTIILCILFGKHDWYFWPPCSKIAKMPQIRRCLICGKRQILKKTESSDFSWEDADSNDS